MKKVFLYLDEYSKCNIKIDNSVFNSVDIKIIDNLQEIAPDDEWKTLIVLEGAMRQPSIFQEVVLYKTVCHLDCIFMGDVADYRVLLEPVGESFVCDLSLLDFELIQSAIYHDKTFLSPGAPIGSSVEYAKTILASNIHTETYNLACNYLSSLERERQYVSVVEKLNASIANLNAKNMLLKSENEKWQNGCSDILRRTDELNKMLVRYEEAFSKDVYYKFNLHNYPNRPLIVYLKEINDFLGLDQLIEVLVNAFRLQRRESVKVVRLFDSNNSHKMRLMPGYYTILRNKYTVAQIVNADYLCKSGDYINLIERLLVNKYDLGVLIIVDSKEHDDVILKGSFLQYNLCRECEQAKRFGLPQDYTVVNEEVPNWLSWLPAEKELPKEDLFIKLSSRQVVQNILQLSGMFMNAF